MTEYDEYRKLVVGKTLTNLFFTKQDGPHYHLPGISPAYYFSTIIELDNERKLRFGNDFIVDWKDEVPIITLTNENWDLPKRLEFREQKIVDLILDEYQELTFLLENGTTIAQRMGYGIQLFIENENISDTEKETDKRPNLNISSLPKVVRPWWKKLFGSK